MRPPVWATRLRRSNWECATADRGELALRSLVHFESVSADLFETFSSPVGCDVPDVAQAVANLVTALRRGGTLPVAVPASTPHDDREPADGGYWRFQRAGLDRLVRKVSPCAEPSIAVYGNLVATIAFLHGLNAEDLSERELGTGDERFPLVICARLDSPAG